MRSKCPSLRRHQRRNRSSAGYDNEAMVSILRLPLFAKRHQLSTPQDSDFQDRRRQ